MPGPWEKYQGAASAAPQGPWTKYAAPQTDFAANPPPAAGPHVDMQAHDLIGPIGKDHYPSASEEVGDLAAGTAKNAAQVSTPGIIASLMNKFAPSAAAKLPDVVTKNATPMEELPGQVMQTGLTMLAGGLDSPEPTPVPRGSIAEAMPKAAGESGGMGSRIAEIAKRRAGHIPGVQAVKDIDYVVRGAKPAAASEAPAPSLSSDAAGVPSGWQQPSPELAKASGLMEGGKPPADPAAGLGQIPVRGAIAEKMAAPTNAEPSPIAATPAAQQSAAPPPAPRPITRGSINKMMGTQLDNALGAKQLDPKVPLRGQVAAKMPVSSEESELPAGHKAVDSSAVRSYGYRADAREFEARATSGNTIYVYGDVPPEVAAGFESAPSKGKAWQQIRQYPLVAKIVDGKRIAVKPAGAR